jgi:hypothetical protein
MMKYLSERKRYIGFKETGRHKLSILMEEGIWILAVRKVGLLNT